MFLTTFSFFDVLAFFMTVLVSLVMPFLIFLFMGGEQDAAAAFGRLKTLLQARFCRYVFDDVFKLETLLSFFFFFGSLCVHKEFHAFYVWIFRRFFLTLLVTFFRTFFLCFDVFAFLMALLLSFSMSVLRYFTLCPVIRATTAPPFDSFQVFPLFSRFVFWLL